MAVGPLVLLIMLNIFVVYQVVRRPKDPDSDIVSLILVVCLFIFCNFMALLVNFLELTLYGWSAAGQPKEINVKEPTPKFPNLFN